MAKCSFCDKHIEPGTGVIYVASDAVYNFCSSKCMKNVKLGRDKRKMAWIRKAKISEEEMKQELLDASKKKEEKKDTAAEKKEEKKPEQKVEKKEEKKPEPKAEKKEEKK